MHRGRVSGIGADGARPLDDQRDGIVLAHGRQVELAFTGDPERLAARCHDPKSRRGREQVGERPGRPGQQLLEVVEDDMGRFSPIRDAIAAELAPEADMHPVRLQAVWLKLIRPQVSTLLWKFCKHLIRLVGVQRTR